MSLRLVFGHERRKLLCKVRSDTAATQFLFNAAQFGKLAQNARASRRAEQIGKATHNRVGAYPRKAVASAAFHANGEV